MAEVVLYRIDERLIHGQVMTAWLGTVGAENIAIIDDILSKDSFMQNIFKMAVPQEISVDILSVNDAINVLKKQSFKKRTIVLMKTIKTATRLIDAGVKIDSINLGGIGAAAGRKPFYKNVFASPEEVEMLKKLVNKGINVYYQVVPEQSAVSIKKILEDKGV
ncbi:PTS system mannose/fructose/N-acetylgalactosamine-transporter subunit IIB [Tepidanaerobacter acetatoxydans]|uniref:PTS system mannose/fructose/N-acetylgalactosamine-transporter subunit IIB n=1 Tax=Tepidanaerobacter acetatoxydans TaxID=499229 RepID=UPI001BD4FF14|nr:PTS sugar transporter subunit IIB [Tepidanaerobacter acetatoxydans]